MSDLAQRLQTAVRDRYRIERELGRGGMATVFLAEDLRHRRLVAIKVLDPEVSSAVGAVRFTREIEAVAGLTHPHILPLHDSGAAGGMLYYVMPYVAGESLRHRLAREGQLPLAEALRLTREVAEALEHAHRAGFVHRDIKPENVLLEAGHAVVADFGLACALDPALDGRLTTAGLVVGTPAYMSPEQASGSGTVDARTDQYSLACMLYEMLAGVPPFVGPTAQSLIHQHLSVAPRPVTDLRPSVPAPVGAAIARALAKAPADRFASVAEFAAALEAASGAGEAAQRALESAPTAAMEAPRDGAHPVPAAARHATSGSPQLVTVALGALALAVLAFVAWQRWGGHSAAASAHRDWILVADFSGPPGDSTLAPAVRGLLSAALDQSSLVATVPPEQVRQALASAGKPSGEPLSPELAHELAYRSAVRAVLEGSVGRLGRGYSLVLRVTDVDSSRVVLVRSATARDDDALIPALDGLAKSLRRGLGENRDALAATRPMVLAATASFDAYRLYTQARARLRRSGANREAIRLSRAALDIDPHFASAWLEMVYPYNNIGYPDSAQACLDQARRWPERLTPAQRASIGIRQAFLDGDLPKEFAAYERALADDPTDPDALYNSANLLNDLGRPAEALPRVVRAMRSRAFGPVAPDWELETNCLARLGRFDEARQASRHLTGLYRNSIRVSIELMSAHMALAESLATATMEDPRLLEELPEGSYGFRALARFARGDAVGAVAALQVAIERDRRAQDWGVDYYHMVWAELCVTGEGALPPPPELVPEDTSSAAIAVRGLCAALGRDSAGVRRCLAALRRRPSRNLRDMPWVPVLLEARLAALAGRPATAVQFLRPLAVPHNRNIDVDLTWTQWWLADAYEQLGQADSAAWCLARVESLSHDPNDVAERPYVHRRLALIEARLGRTADARRHLADTERAWDRPDPAVRRLLDEAHAAVERFGATPGAAR